LLLKENAKSKILEIFYRYDRLGKIGPESGSRPKHRPEFPKRERVDDIFCGQPAPPCSGNSKIHGTEAFPATGVRAQRKTNTMLPGGDASGIRKIDTYMTALADAARFTMNLRPCG
jgi:hypothetical protein